MLITRRDAAVISDFRFQEELQPLSDDFEIVIRKGSMPDAQKALIRKLKPKALGVQSEHLPADARSFIASAAGPSHVKDIVGLTAALRMVKDAREVDAIRAGIKIQQEALLAVLPGIRPGQSEREIAAVLEYECKRRGAQGMSFETIVAAKANGSKPHYRPGGEKTAKGRPLLIDWGVRARGYCSDMTRTFCLGSWPRKMETIYRVVLEAQEAAIAAAGPGMTCGALDMTARGIIERAGFGPMFGHGLGHGIGLDIHENPRVFKTTSTVLEPGMVVTIEPGIYLPGVGGVRIEDDILITERGAKNLCSLPKDLKWATLHG